MTPWFLILWLAVWVLKRAPAVTFDGANEWAVALIVCAVIDLYQLVRPGGDD